MVEDGVDHRAGLEYQFSGFEALVKVTRKYFKAGPLPGWFSIPRYCSVFVFFIYADFETTWMPSRSVISHAFSSLLPRAANVLNLYKKIIQFLKSQALEYRFSMLITIATVKPWSFKAFGSAQVDQMKYQNIFEITSSSNFKMFSSDDYFVISQCNRKTAAYIINLNQEVYVWINELTQMYFGHVKTKQKG